MIHAGGDGIALWDQYSSQRFVYAEVRGRKSFVLSCEDLMHCLKQIHLHAVLEMHKPFSTKMTGRNARHSVGYNNYTFPVRRLGVFRNDLMITPWDMYLKNAQCSNSHAANPSCHLPQILCLMCLPGAGLRGFNCLTTSRLKLKL